MAEGVPGLVPVSAETRRRAAVRTMTEPAAIRLLLIAVAAATLLILVALPLMLVFAQAFQRGVGTYFAKLAQAETWSAIKLTLLVSLIVVPANTAFGLVVAWLMAKHRFRG